MSQQKRSVGLLLLLLLTYASAKCLDSPESDDDGCMPNLYRTDCKTGGLNGCCVRCDLRTHEQIESQTVTAEVLCSVVIPPSDLGNLSYCHPGLYLNQYVTTPAPNRCIAHFEMAPNSACPLDISINGNGEYLIRRRLLDPASPKLQCNPEECRIIMRYSGTGCHSHCAFQGESIVQVPPYDLIGELRNELHQSRRRSLDVPVTERLVNCFQRNQLLDDVRLNQTISFTYFNNRNNNLAPRRNTRCLPAAAVNISITHHSVVTQCAPSGLTRQEIHTVTRQYTTQCGVIGHLVTRYTWDETEVPRIIVPTLNRQCPPSPSEFTQHFAAQLINQCGQVETLIPPSVISEPSDCRFGTRGRASYRWQSAHCGALTLMHEMDFTFEDNQLPTIVNGWPNGEEETTASQTEYCNSPMPASHLALLSGCGHRFELAANILSESHDGEVTHSTYQWNVTDACGLSHRQYTLHHSVDHSHGPRLEVNQSNYQPALAFQCRNQVPPFNPNQYTFSHRCANAIVNVSAREFSDVTDIEDDVVIHREVVARDMYGNELILPQTITVRDTEAPVLLFSAATRRQSCLWPPTGHYVCFHNITQHLIPLWQRDNCGKPFAIEWDTCVSHDCSTDDGYSCNQAVPARVGNQPACSYVPRGDRLCMRVERPVDHRARRYQVTAYAVDKRGNETPFTMRFIVPGRGYGEERPIGQTGHPCDGHQRINVPTTTEARFETVYGTSSMVTQLDSLAVGNSRAHHTKSAEVSGATVAVASLASLATVAMVITWFVACAVSR